ncbi:hypothetical protein HMPREF3039_02234 [Akkermansia sp. KLE1798]|nr:hypothetical protein HMPREF3039_02234 [Akkermansia sp. KLE1798]KZA05708.1 hypothetical protein HMPREF1326_00533 [Akkermansia sp. KLE1605]
MLPLRERDGGRWLCLGCVPQTYIRTAGRVKFHGFASLAVMEKAFCTVEQIGLQKHGTIW